MSSRLLNRIGLLFVALVVVSPAILFFLWMISLSLKFEIDNGAYPPIFIPERFAWSNYAQVFAREQFLPLSLEFGPGHGRARRCWRC